MGKYCKNCGVPVDKDIDKKLTRCGNCGELLGLAVENSKEYLVTASDFARKILKEFPETRDSDWAFLDRYTNTSDRRFSPSTMIRERETNCAKHHNGECERYFGREDECPERISKQESSEEINIIFEDWSLKLSGENPAWYDFRDCIKRLVK